MKKLIVAACAIAFAAVSQAASIAWGSDQNGIVLDNGDWADGQVTMYLYEITATDFASFSGSADEISKAVFDKYGTTSENNMLDDWGATMLDDSRTFGNGDTAYAAVIFSYTDENGKDYFKGNIASYTFDSDNDAQVNMLDVNLGGDGSVQGGEISWQSAEVIPEPTSGLLMLLGMAGLALRRRRA